MVDERVLVADCAEQAALFQKRVAALFERLPMLCGFHVTEDLRVVEVAVHAWPGWMPAPGIADEITAAIKGLIVDGPENAAALLRGTTLARRLH